MEIKSMILTFLFLISGFVYYSFTDDETVINSVGVVRIIDGDTIETDAGDRIRLKGINTPEKTFMGSLEATQFLSDKVLNKSIKVKSYGEDKYGRTLGFLILNGENVNAEILERGLATLYYYDKDEFYDEMKSSEEFAQLNNLGLWKKSINSDCLELVEFNFNEPEKLVLKNKCNLDLEVLIKDDATHMYEETMESFESFELETSHIWNDAGDSVYVFDDKGLLIFYRY